MDDSELFDIFNIDNNPEPEQKTVVTTTDATTKKRKQKKPKKSKEEKNVISGKDKSTNGFNGKRSHEDISTTKSDDDEEEEVENTTVSKKSRKMDENPIIVDSFETESDQIVPATQGFQGIAPTDQNIIIKKKVPALLSLRKRFPVLTCLLVSTCGCFSNCRLEIYTT